MVRRLISLLTVVVLIAACSPEEAELTTTTTTAPTESTTTTAPQDDYSTSTTEGDGEDDDGASGAAITEYEVVVRSSATAGETLWILINPGEYTDVDLENLIRELVDESDVTLQGINVFDDLVALEAGRIDADARTPEEQALVDEHFLVSLVDASTIRFEGPYAEFGETA
ncbi:MAG: hypothetical protein WD532_08610, partial [Acidimicrobiia bacterium]